MSKKTLHPSVQQFKSFVKKHPLILKEINDGTKTLQDFYEEWTILGEKDDMWVKYEKTDEVNSEQDVEDQENQTEETTDQSGSQSKQFGDLLSMLKTININEIQTHVQNLSGIMATVQGLLQSFQSNGSSSSQPEQNKSNQQSPFNFRQF